MKDIAIKHTNNVAFSIRDRHFLEALTRWNYFPNQKLNASELPPCITTRRLTPEICRELARDDTTSKAIQKERNASGFDLVEYKMTRYNNVSRTLGLIHPLAYSYIFQVLEENIENLHTSMKDANSAIQVDHHLDGRIFIMNYEDSDTKSANAAERSFGKRFRAHTDIANCFGSVYSHSLEWAVQGFKIAKKKRAENRTEADKHWSSRFDRAIRRAKRGETVGLPIGPATSSIAVEILLAAVDQKLRENDFEFTRYVDDYTCLTETHQRAQEFIMVLGAELNTYKLNVSLAKTSIIELPMPLQDSWVSRLMSVAPALLNSDGNAVNLHSSEVYLFLDNAVRLNNETPDGSILRYALGAICDRVSGHTAILTFTYALNLSWHYPALLPYLEKINIKVEDLQVDMVAKKLNEILIVNAINRRSDGMCWALYYLKQLEQELSGDAVSAVLRSDDCLSIAMLCRFATGLDKALDFATQLADDLYTKDQYWLLFYVLYTAGRIDNPYSEDRSFEILKNYEVDFFCNPGDYSLAETYCAHTSNPFLTEQEKKTFDEFMRDKNSN